MRLYRNSMFHVKWQVPALFNNDIALATLLSVMKLTYEHEPKLTIDSVYGAMDCSWVGGRPSVMDYDEESFKYLINYYNSLGITCYLTFSNYHVDNLDDMAGNAMLEILNGLDFQNWAIVSDDKLADYIREAYPNIKLEASVLKPVYEFEEYSEPASYYNELSSRYDRVVIRPEKLRDENFLRGLKNKHKMVCMVNQTCKPNCFMARDHYEFYAGRGPKKEWCSPYHTDTCALDYYDICGLINNGLDNFKLQGRNILAKDFLSMLGTYVFEPTGDIQMLIRKTLRKMNEK